MTNFLKKVAVAGSTFAMVASMALVNVATVSAASAGEVYKTTDGTVWFITKDMEKRPFTSSGAFLSYGFLSFSQVKDADSTVTALPTGSFIAPQDGRIFCATETKGTDVKGECSLVTGGQKAAFTSSAVFTGQGFSFSRAFYGDSSFLAKTSNVDSASAQHRAGTLINNGGTVQLVVSGGLWGVPSESVFNSWGWSFSDVVPANSADTSLSQTGVIPSRMAGDLVPTATDDTPPTSDCNVDGDAGDLTLTLLSTYSAESVGEGEEEVPVLAFDAEADNGSDVAVNSVKVELEQTVTSNSQDITDYISEVVVMLDGEVVGSADAEDFSESNDRYSKSIALDDCTIIDAGDTREFSIGITALDSLDSGDVDNDSWDAEIDSVRFEDADGVVSTETPAANDIDQAFDMDLFAGATDVEMKVALSDNDDINLAHVIDIDDTEDTNDEVILEFTIEADGDSDLNIQEIPAVITTTGETDESVLTADARLWLDGEDIASDTIPAGGAVTFEDLDIDIDAGDMATFQISVDIQDTTGAADNADTVKAELTTTNVDDIIAEDASGTRVVDGDASGSAVAGANAVYDSGIMVEFVEGTATRTAIADAAGESDTGEFKITFDVTAFDGDMRIDKTCETDNGSNAAGEGSVFDEIITAADTTGWTFPCSLSSSDTDTEDNSNVFEVDEGTTRTFTITTAHTPDEDSFVQVVLESINWGTATDDTNANYYNFNMGDFKTPNMFLNDM